MEGPVSSNLLAPPTKHTAILDRRNSSFNGFDALPFTGAKLGGAIEEFLDVDVVVVAAAEGRVIRDAVLLRKWEARGGKEEKGLMGVKETVRKRRRVRGGMVKWRGFQYRLENHLDMKGVLVIFCGDVLQTKKKGWVLVLAAPIKGEMAEKLGGISGVMVWFCNGGFWLGDEWPSGVRIIADPDEEAHMVKEKNREESIDSPSGRIDEQNIASTGVSHDYSNKQITADPNEEADIVIEKKGEESSDSISGRIDEQIIAVAGVSHDYSNQQITADLDEETGIMKEKSRFYDLNESKGTFSGLKVETKDPEWHRTLTKVLKRIKGVSYAIDVEQGMAYIRGRVDPNKLLKKLSKGGKHADICWVETGNMNPYMSNGYQYPPPDGGYPQPGPGYHPGYHPGYAMASYYPKRPPPYSGYGYGYGYDPRGYEFPTWA
ncbi:hypothetical protein DKX38_001847 [Salix brachista]|uniref:HMA domain-containing protein n=1 Tax=Salix brachista TaxID=2182728 RepID=A0A5N5NKJ8_9ROSI|nr:hypothetical protein DKX38_001847 [Salix brachista]